MCKVAISPPHGESSASIFATAVATSFCKSKLLSVVIDQLGEEESLGCGSGVSSGAIPISFKRISPQFSLAQNLQRSYIEWASEVIQSASYNLDFVHQPLCLFVMIFTASASHPVFRCGSYSDKTALAVAHRSSGIASLRRASRRVIRVASCCSLSDADVEVT